MDTDDSGVRFRMTLIASTMGVLAAVFSSVVFVTVEQRRSADQTAELYQESVIQMRELEIRLRKLEAEQFELTSQLESLRASSMLSQDLFARFESLSVQIRELSERLAASP